MSRAGWSRKSTFCKHYYRPQSEESTSENFSKAVLSQATNMQRTCWWAGALQSTIGEWLRLLGSWMLFPVVREGRRRDQHVLCIVLPCSYTAVVLIINHKLNNSTHAWMWPRAARLFIQSLKQPNSQNIFACWFPSNITKFIITTQLTMCTAIICLRTFFPYTLIRSENQSLISDIINNCHT